MSEILQKAEEAIGELTAYTYDEVLAASTIYFSGDTLAAKVFTDKYALHNNGVYFELTPNDMHHRLAKEFGRIESGYDKKKCNGLSTYGQTRSDLDAMDIYGYFKDFKYIVPQGSVMSMLGNASAIGSLSNCIVLPKVADSYGGIAMADQQLMQLMKRRCGVGLDLSTLRPNGMPVTNAAGTGTGPVSFMERFSNTTREVAQCFSPDTRIFTNRGIFKIHEIVEKKLQVKVLTHTGYEEIIGYFKNGRKKIFEVVTKNGKIKITDDHELCVINPYTGKLELKPLFNLSIGDDILINSTENNTTVDYIKLNDVNYNRVGLNKSNRLNDIEMPKTLDEDVAYFIGLLYANGCMHKNKKGHYSFSITLSDIDVARGTFSKITEILKTKFRGINLLTKNVDKKYGNYITLLFNSNKIAQFLIENDIEKTSSSTIKVPEKIFKSNTSVINSFIAGFFDGDGNVIRKHNGELEFRGYKINTTNKELLEDIQVLLLSSGIVSNLTVARDEPILYKLSITSAEFRKRFYNNIGKVSCKILSSEINENISNDKTFYYPETILSPDAMPSYKKMMRYKSTDTSTLKMLSFKQLLSIDPNNEYVNTIQSEILEINELWVSDTYDISVANQQKLYANGIYASNCGRRGALMLTLDVAHPDVAEFATIKQDLSKVTGANISIRISDEFMEAVDTDTEYTHRWPIDSDAPVVTKTINARELWDLIIKVAHESAEPGLIFWDRQHKYSTSSVYPGRENISTNPCSEIGMDNDSCRLVALNLFGCIEDAYTKHVNFNFEKLYEVTYEAMRLMDDLVDLELESVEKIIDKIKSDPEPEYVKQCELHTWEELYRKGKEGRRTGLGITALADTIAVLNLKYDSLESLEFVDEMMRVKTLAEFDSSIDMAIERGQFTGFDRKIEDTSEFVQMLKTDFPKLYTRMMKYGRRNISLSTIAPTGSLSLLTQTSSGIEPVFMLSYTRRVKMVNNDDQADYVDDLGDRWKEHTVFHNKLKQWTDATNQPIDESPWYGATANDIKWEYRVKMQGILQKYVTHAISSTINLPSDTTTDIVGSIYLESWKAGLKGITVYRDGSRSGVIVSSDDKKEDVPTKGDNNAPKRPKYLDCDVLRFMNKGEKWIGFIGLMDGRPYEVFTGKADAMSVPHSCEGGRIRKTKVDGEMNGEKCKVSKYDFIYKDYTGSEVECEWLNTTFNEEYFNYAKLISGILRHKMPLPSVVSVIQGLNIDNQLISTWKGGVVRMIKRYIADGTAAKDKKCAECGTDALVYQEGCLICTNCGSSKCSS